MTVKLRQFYKRFCCNKYIDETFRAKKPFRDRLGGTTYIRQGSLVTCLSLTKLLIEDSEACIYKGSYTDSNETYAVKVPKPHEKQYRRILKECLILSSLDGNPNFVKVHDFEIGSGLLKFP